MQSMLVYRPFLYSVLLSFGVVFALTLQIMPPLNKRLELTFMEPLVSTRRDAACL